MADQQQLDLTYLEMAELWSGLSHARRKKVGCLIVKDGSIISDGFNGMPSGFDNNCENEHSFGLVPLEPPLYEEAKTQKIGLGVEKFVRDEGKVVTELATKPEVLHAESNAISKLAKSTQSSKGATMYITIAPCLDCAKLIIQSGITRVIFREDYRSDDGVALLLEANLDIDQK